MTEIDDLEAELLTNVQIGSDSKITSEFYQPLDALAKWFVAPAVRIEARDLPIYQNNSRDRRLSRSRGGGRHRCRAQSRQLGRDPRRTAPYQRR